MEDLHISGGALVAIGGLLTALSGVIGILFRALMKSQDERYQQAIADKDAQIVRERDRADHWEEIGLAALDRLEVSLDVGGAAVDGPVSAVRPPGSRVPRRRSS